MMVRITNWRKEPICQWCHGPALPGPGSFQVRLRASKLSLPRIPLNPGLQLRDALQFKPKSA
eukprot:2224059-Rhodomonas_salina.1